MQNVEKLVTPVCSSKYLWIFGPNTKFDQDGVYSITCVMEETQPWANLQKLMQSRLEEYYDSACKIARKKLKRCEHLPWKVIKDDAGQVIEKVFVAKNNALGRTKDGKTFTTQPRVVGPDPNIVLKESDLDGKLGAGTQVRVGFGLNLWQNEAQGVGLSARLSMVQIIKPVYYDPMGGYTDPEGGDGFTKIPSDWFKPKPKPTDGGGQVDQSLADQEFLEGLKGY